MSKRDLNCHFAFLAVTLMLSQSAVYADDAAVPDFLRQYDPGPTTTTTTTTTAPPTTTTTTEATTAVGPIVTPPATVPATIGPTPVKPNVTEAPKPPASAKPVPMLKGRLEEIQGNGANLPVGLLLNLKAQKAQLDKSVLVPHSDPLKGLVSSFPSDWQGNWGGSLSIWWTQMDKAAWDFDADEANQTAQILKRGNQGTTTFSFYQSGKNILVQPARVTFPPRQNSYTQQQLQGQMGSLGGMFANNPMAQQMLNSLSMGIPVLVLGDLSGVGVTGNALRSTVVKNDIKQLKPGVLEENLVVNENERNARTGQVRNSFSETILRFTKINPTQLYVQAASIKYRNDGHFLEKVIMYGTVNRGVTTPDPAANPLGGMPGFGAGSIPGLPSSGGGGFGDLNQMLKQLQGM